MRVTIDLMKKSTQIIDLSNVINPRVGDDDLLLPLHIIYGDNQTDMRGKDVEFLSNDPNKKNIYIAGTCNTNTPGDNLYMGDLTFRFPAGTFQADGTYDPDKTMFRIVDKETQKVISSVNVKITVMKSNIEFDFDPDNSSYDSRLETMLHDFHDKGQTMLDEIKDLKNQANSNVSGDTATTAKEAKKQADQNAGDISDLKGEVAGARGRFANMAGREDAQDAAINQKESIVNANANYAALKQKDNDQDAVIAQKAGKFELEDKLSQMDLQPEGFENEAALKAKYPNGKPGIMVTADTGHKWLWINGAWKDCGVYQSASPTNETLDARKWNTKLGRVTSDSLGNAIRQQFDQVEAQFNNILDTAIPDMTDQSGKIVPKQKLKLDKSLTSEVLPAQAKAVRDAITLQPERYQLPFTWYNESLPILKIEGQIPAADGVKSQVSYSYQGMNGSATLKWQGQSSLSFPKKNFTIKFDKSFTAKGGWLSTDTYVLKGNFNDFTHARNIVSAQLWGDVVKSRGWSTEDILDNDGTPLLDNDGTPLQIYQDTMAGLINGGAIDGFPIMLVVNGDFYGLYDFQIKKSRTMFGFEKGNHSQYAISCERTPQNKNGAAIHFKGAAILDGNDYDYEYVADDGDKANAKASFNYMLQKVIDATGSDYANTLEGYLDVDSVIDYMLFTALITASDDVTKNFLMLSYNGTKWYFSAYDMDCTFGNWQDGWIREDPDHAAPSIQHWSDANRAMHLVCAYDADRVKARYQELRKGPLSDTNVYKRFISYMSLTPVAVKNADVKLWPTTPATVAHSFSQIFNEFKLRVSVIDQQIANL